MLTYLRSSLGDWKSWWRAATTTQDRVLGGVFGAIAGLILGFATRLLLGPIPAPWEEFVIWALGGGLILSSLGVMVPKPVLLMSAPFVRVLEAI
ncbi:MAG: hypothetical protein Aurels2KO_56740 [Aureliella sp.]